MSCFALVHGSMHGHWHWTHLIAALEALGHEAVGPDLPCDDAAAGLDDYADVMEEALRGRQDVVLVGHSLGGRSLPVVAARRPVERLVFLCCVPTPLRPIDPATFADMVTPEFAAAPHEERPDGSRRMRPEAAERLFFDDCAPDLAREAARQLRFQGPRPLAEAPALARWPERPMDVILTRDDRAVRLDWARAEARRWLRGAEPRLLDGSHSPFLSRPSELARSLVACAQRSREPHGDALLG